MHKIGFVLGALIMLSSASMLHAQPPQHQRRMGSMREHREAVIEKLQLSDAQKDQMRKLHLDLEKKQAAVQAKIRMTRLDIKELLLADKPDKGAIEKQMKIVSDLQYQAKVNHLEHMFAVKDMLTAEQQKTMKELLRDHIGGMRRWGRGMGMMGMGIMGDQPGWGMLDEEAEMDFDSGPVPGQDTE